MSKRFRDGTEPTRNITQVMRLLPLFAWAVISIYLARWLTPKVWPTPRNNSMLFALILGMGQAAVVVVRLASDQSLAAAIRRRRRGLSGPELVWMAVAICWLVAFMSVLLTGPGRLFWRGEFWFESGVFVVLMGMLVSFTSMMQAIRRP